MAITLNNKNGMTDASYTNVQETFPVSIAGTGEISAGNGTNTRVLGDGNTLFLSEFQIGDFIWDDFSGEIREVESIADDNTLTLKIGFGEELDVVSFRIVKKTGYRSVSWGIDSAAGATINGIAYEAGMSRTIGNSNPGVRRVAPVLIDTFTSLNTVFIAAE
jgi:hypothetical protein